MTQAHDLQLIGDALQQAARRDLRPRRRLLVRGLALAAVLAALGSGAALASGLFSSDQVEQGMPAGSAIFGGTHPTCVLQGDGITYACTLASLPTQEIIGDHRGAKELVTIDEHIAGGCIGQDREGRHWNCYLGREAVKRQILVADLLGQYAPAPGHG